MQESAFKQLLLSATEQAKQFALEYIEDKLPPGHVYTIQLNLSHDNPALTQFDLYLEDNGKQIRYADTATVIKTLFRKGKVPVWIDISVSTIQAGRTVFSLLCAGRYTDDLQEMYYHQRGNGPFGIKSPNLPAGFQNGTKFWLPKSKKTSLMNRLFRWRR